MIKTILKYKFLIILMIITLISSAIYNSLPSIKEVYTSFEESNKTTQIMASLIDKVSKNRSVYLDKRGNLSDSVNKDDFPVDVWGNKLTMTIYNYKIAVYSSGADKIPATIDDIIKTKELPHGFIYNIFGI